MITLSTHRKIIAPWRIIAAAVLLIGWTFSAQAQVMTNGSLEGSTGSSTVPPNWANCGGSPDTQIISGSGGGIFGINTPPSDGSSYLGMVTTSYGYIEAAGQPASIISGSNYTGSVDLFRSTLHTSWNGTGQLQIWGGTSCANRNELLWTSGTITNQNNWQTYPISFTPTSTHSYIIFVNYFNTGTGSMDYFCMDDIQLTTTVLDVNLVSFEAEDAGQAVDMSWETGVMQGGEQFDVQWSSDTRNWEEIGTLNAQKDETMFGFRHEQPVPGMNYYRLRTLDLNGLESFSGVRQVDFAQDHVLSQWPNPATDALNLTLRLYEDRSVDIRMTDAAGRIVAEQAFERTAGTHTVTLGLDASLANGLYHMQVDLGDRVLNRPVVIQR